MDSDGKEQKLRLVFVTHEILISGHVLRRIETAICRLELSGLMKLPEKYHALIAEGQPKIREIVVTEIKLALNKGSLIDAHGIRTFIAL